MHKWKFWSEEELERLKKDCKESANFIELKTRTLGKYGGRSWASIESQARRHSEWIKYFSTEEVPAEKKKKWIGPVVLEINKEAWERPGVRIGCMSGISYKNQGYRAGLIRLATEIFAHEGTRFNVFNGKLVDKKYIQAMLQERLRNVSRELRQNIINNFYQEVARELNLAIPKIKTPNNNEYVRLYLTTSSPFDGFHGEEIAKRLQELREQDIRHHKPGSARLDLKQPWEEEEGKKKYIWAINPTRSRLPTKYYSLAAEREIDEKKGQTTKPPPEAWVVAPFASNIHKPDGERDEPYITLGALQRLEEAPVAENQVSVSIIEFTPDGNRFVRVWSLKDLVANERKLITGIKSGANEIHRKIVDVIKESGSMTIGLITDELGLNRQLIDQEIKFLEEKKKLPRKTWPGLFYDKHSQRYDFHIDWFQENLSYPPIYKEEFLEDIILLFGCLHAGFTTTDYKFVVSKMPEIILKYGVQTLAALGDLIAGLRHGYLYTGEVFGNLNNTDQEKFAAELIGTVIIKVFKERFKVGLSKYDTKNLSRKEITQKEVEDLINEALILFLYIPGNHDIWQEREGQQPLKIFREKLINLLLHQMGRVLAEEKLPAVDLLPIIRKKIIGLLDYDNIYRLPSGLHFEMCHPFLARAETTSLRAQKTLDASKSQIIGIANFHTATVTHKWFADRGQCVAAQTGCLVIYTRYEKRKTKRIDFGPVFLRVLSKDNRIVMTESAYFNKPVITEPIPKWTNLDQLKEQLGIPDAP